tara:strand:- start:1333 stop:1446 length:114 start_codon:yes stop_codon:yes gene_type:complete
MDLDMEITSKTIHAIALGTQTIIKGIDTPSLVIFKRG